MFAQVPFSDFDGSRDVCEASSVFDFFSCVLSFRRRVCVKCQRDSVFDRMVGSISWMTATRRNGFLQFLHDAEVTSTFFPSAQSSSTKRPSKVFEQIGRACHCPAP